jgi:hypothetical protein
MSLLMALGTPFFPHSPQWLLLVGRAEDVHLSRIKLGVQAVEDKKEDQLSASIPVASDDAAVLAEKQYFWNDHGALFAKDVRWRTIFCLFIAATLQVCSFF